MNRAQAEWAEQHDWHVDTIKHTCGVYGSGYEFYSVVYRDEDGEWVTPDYIQLVAKFGTNEEKEKVRSMLAA